MPEYNPSARLDTSQIRDLRRFSKKGSNRFQKSKRISAGRRTAILKRLQRYRSKQKRQREINY